MTKLKVGIIGAGTIANLHLSVIKTIPDVTISGIADINYDQAVRLGRAYACDDIFRDAEQLIKVTKPDVVHVLVPPHYHAEISRLAMENGCHVLVEKPMAPTLQEALQMVECAHANKVQLCVNHNYVFEEVIRKALRLVKSGIIGKLVYAEAKYAFDPTRYPAILDLGAQVSHWAYRLNGGPLQDLAPHPASFLAEFLEDIETVKSVGYETGKLGKGWQDEIRVIVGDSNGMICNMVISLNERPDTVSLILNGKKGRIHADLFSGIITLSTASALPRAISRGLFGFHQAKQFLSGAFGNIYNFVSGKVDKTVGMGSLIPQFYESLRHDLPLPVSIRKSLLVVELLERIWPESKKINQKLPLQEQGGIDTIDHPIAFVTGGSGFIGTHLVKKLIREGFRVRVLIRPDSPHMGRMKALGVEIFEGDLGAGAKILNQAMKGASLVFHAGAAMNSNWDDHRRVNIKGTEEMVSTALSNRVDRFVFFSSLAVYELLDKADHAVITESSPYQKHPERMNPYAFSKIAGEKLVIDAHQSKGLKMTIIRPGIVLGPYGRIFYPQLGYRYGDSLFLPVGKGNVHLPLTYIDNLVNGIYLSSTVNKAIGEKIQFIDDGDITVNSFLEKFIEMTGARSRIFHLPYPLVWAAVFAYECVALTGKVKKGVTSRAQLQWKMKNVRYDNSKAKRLLGWENSISIEKGIENTFKWYANKYM